MFPYAFLLLPFFIKTQRKPLFRHDGLGWQLSASRALRRLVKMRSGHRKSKSFCRRLRKSIGTYRLFHLLYPHPLTLLKRHL
jgi:hypothetical protein